MVQASPAVAEFTQTHGGLSLFCLIGTIASMCMIACCFGRTVPLNYILLLVFTACESYMVATITTAYDPKIVLAAGCATALVTIALTIYAWRTDVPIEFFGAMLFVIYLALLPLSIICMFMHIKALYTLYLCVGLLFYSVYLIYDTKLICDSGETSGGYSLSFDDYILGAIMLYIDIIMIFLYLLRLFGDRR